MKPEAQRITIAKVCGFIPNGAGYWHKNGRVYGLVAEAEDIETIGIGGYATPAIPDYLSDLNAMHEAEKVLTAEQRAAYWKELWLVVKPKEAAVLINSEALPYLVSATAAQRAKALLKVLNLWEN